MKKLVLLLVLTLVGCTNTKVPIDEVVIEQTEYTSDNLTHYEIDVELDDESHKLLASQTVTYQHKFDTDEMYFHIYPNAFNENGHPSLFDKNKDEIDDDIGYLVFSSIQVNGVEVSYDYKPIGTVVKIDYSFIEDENYVIEMVYEVGIPPASERFGIVDDIYNLGNWYPVMAVYDEDGWNLDPYLYIGDPFYSLTSNYDVNISVPKDYIVAGSGYIYETLESDLKTYRFRAENMRDFALAISKNFMTLDQKVGNTNVILYYPEALNKHRWLDEALTYATSTIELYNELIGEYTYKTYSVVITNFPSGMEYPGLVLISDNYFNTNLDRLRKVIVHETVHQWFYGMIGDDEIDEGWIDEGLTTYFTAFYDLKMGEESYYHNTIKGFNERVNNHGDIQINKSAYEFDNWDDYGAAAYSKAALIYEDLYTTYGEKKFLEFASSLYDEYRYDVLKEEDLRHVLSIVYGESIQEFLKKWLE